MGEYWNLFLNYINTVGRMFAEQLYPGLRIAPPAEIRYANSHPFETYVSGFPMSHYAEGYLADGEKIDGLGSILAHRLRPAEIMRYINEPGDTVYIEKPESSVYGGMLDYRYPRKASTKDPRGNDYNTLKKRYNIAKKLAKKK